MCDRSLLGQFWSSCSQTVIPCPVIHVIFSTGIDRLPQRLQLLQLASEHLWKQHLFAPWDWRRAATCAFLLGMIFKEFQLQ